MFPKLLRWERISRFINSELSFLLEALSKRLSRFSYIYSPIVPFLLNSGFVTWFSGSLEALSLRRGLSREGNFKEIKAVERRDCWFSWEKGEEAASKGKITF